MALRKITLIWKYRIRIKAHPFAIIILKPRSHARSLKILTTFHSKNYSVYWYNVLLTAVFNRDYYWWNSTLKSFSKRHELGKLIDLNPSKWGQYYKHEAPVQWDAQRTLHSITPWNWLCHWEITLIFFNFKHYCDFIKKIGCCSWHGP